MHPGRYQRPQCTPRPTRPARRNPVHPGCHERPWRTPVRRSATPVHPCRYWPPWCTRDPPTVACAPGAPPAASAHERPRRAQSSSRPCTRAATGRPGAQVIHPPSSVHPGRRRRPRRTRAQDQSDAGAYGLPLATSVHERPGPERRRCMRGASGRPRARTITGATGDATGAGDRGGRPGRGATPGGVVTPQASGAAARSVR